MATHKKTRQSGPLLDPDIDFPMIAKFSNPKKLPLYSDVIGVLRYLLESKNTNIEVNQALNEVKKNLYSKWYHDTVYCITPASILKRLQKDWAVFKEGKKRLRAGRESGKAIDDYQVLRSKATQLYDIAATSDQRIAQCAEEFGVAMSEHEKCYLSDQRSQRKMECDKGVDPVWYAAMLRKQRQRELSEKYKKEMEERFRFVDLDQIEDVLDDQGAVQEEENQVVQEESENDEAMLPFSTEQNLPSANEVIGTGAKKRKVYALMPSNNDDPLPSEMRHIRKSERIVRDEVYETLADLRGLGLSMNESYNALIKVSNKLFGRKWKLPETNSDVFDCDTLPHPRNFKHAEEVIETKGLFCSLEEVQLAKASGRMITHATDSTTKKGVGQFAVAGIHIGQNVPFCLPLIPIVGERTEDIANQCSLMCEILGAVSNKPPADVYKLVDAHMTDSTEHNKGFAGLMADMYDLDTVAGQLFCGTHTTLGFASGMNKQLAIIERDMTLEAIFKNFMVDLDFDSKHGSVVGQALDCMLRLIAPEYSHKPWNYYRQFVHYLKEQDIKQVLFSYKDQRFGCLSRAAAVMVLIFPYIESFLENNPGITNRLACIVRSFLTIEYFKPALVVFGVIGIQLVEPFYSATIAKGATHSELKIFYQSLHDQMETEVTEDFFELNQPWFRCVSSPLFDGVLKSYGVNVVNALKEMGQAYKEDCVKLCNFIMPELRTILGRQRRDYGISEEFQPQYPVEQQAMNVDDTPVTNMAMERLCGKVDYRLHKLKQLETVSRSIILQQTEALREASNTSFRSFAEEASRVRELKLSWSKQMNEKFKTGTTEKEAVAMQKERKRLEMMEKLKKCGGPFTSAEDVDEFMEVEKESSKKQRRLKLEVQFARESSTCLPKTNPLFRIQVTLPNKSRRDKTDLEFCVALKAILGKRSESSTVSMDQFRNSLENTFVRQ